MIENGKVYPAMLTVLTGPLALTHSNCAGAKLSKSIGSQWSLEIDSLLF
jgi:hypothetical protein